MHFSAMIWTDDTDGSALTLAVQEGAARDVAAYALPGFITDFSDVLKNGMKLTEARARAYGAGWPPSLYYRR